MYNMVKTVKRKRKGGASLSLTTTTTAPAAAAAAAPAAAATSATPENVKEILSNASKKEILEMLQAINQQMELINEAAKQNKINKDTMINGVDGLKEAVIALETKIKNRTIPLDMPFDGQAVGGKRRKSRRKSKKRKRRRSKRR